MTSRRTKDGSSPFSYDDPIEKAVQEIWLQHPGIGIKSLTEKLKDRLPADVHHNLTKPRVKAAKEAIPYRYIENDYEYNCDTDYEHQNEELVKESTETNTSDAHQQQQQPQQNFPFPKEKMEFIQQKIQQRQSLRKEKRYEEADEICRGLETMGICLDDHSKTWTIDIQVVKKRRFEEEKDGDVTTTTESDNGSGIPCGMCGRYFASRNLVFKHLRDVASGCGNQIFASGQSLPVSPQEFLKRQQKEKKFRVRGRGRGSRKKNENEQQQEHTQLDGDNNRNNQKIIDHKACLWFGDIPLPWTTYNLNYKSFRALLREYLPRDVPFPWIQKVVRKSYKDYKNNSSIHLGYAIIVFRDEDEANLVLEKMNGAMIDPEEVFTKDVLNNGNSKKEEETDDDKLLSLPSFVLKVQHHDVASSNKNDNNNNTTSQKKTLAGQDPTLIDQFRPLSTHQLKERIRRWETLRHRRKDNNKVENGDDIGTTTTDTIADNNHHDIVVLKREQQRQLSDYEQYEDCLHQLVQYYTIYDPRTFVHRQGRLLPNCICNRLLDILKNLRWPAEHGRPAMSSERYLVLKPDSVTTQNFFSELNGACADLMQSVDRDYTYSAIAVTKNFVSSPHIDERDQTFQYAVSLGEYDDGGGELCVEGYASQENDDDKEEEGELHHHQKDDYYVNVVDTHNRIGKVDGRHIHWVRTWAGGDRYSLIYYDTRKQNSTPIIPAGVDEEFLKI